MEWMYEIIEPFVVTDNGISDKGPTNVESVNDYDGKFTSRLNELDQKLEFEPKYICRFELNNIPSDFSWIVFPLNRISYNSNKT